MKSLIFVLSSKQLMDKKLTILLVVACLMGASCCSVRENRVFPLEEMAEGDLAFRCGRGVFSRAVTAAEEEGFYSHVGIVVRDDEKWKVVHAVPGERESKTDFDRVKIEDLDVFYSRERAQRGCLVHTGLTDSVLVARLCRSAVEMARDSVRFDNDYNLEDASELYCTEFVWRLYQDCGTDLSEGRRKFVRAFHINGDVLLPEHLLAYTYNDVYYSF